MLTRRARRRSRVAFALVAAVVAGTPGMAGASVTSDRVAEQVKFITSRQLADGAILSAPNRINPYFANMAAMGLARANTVASRTAVKKWMGWYFAHLNRPDASGLSNTVYDYDYDPATGRQTPLNDYDSVDSYAATTLNLAYIAYTTTKSDSSLKQFIAANIAKIESIAYLLIASTPTGVRDSNGLTFAKPSYRAHYLMDNSEVYRGLADLAKLEAALGRTSEADYYAAWATRTQEAVNRLLWNTAANRWDFALGSHTVLSRFYPDAPAQLWPTVFGVTSPKSTQAIAAWSQFEKAWPNWSTAVIGDGFPWAVMARAGQMMGETTNADQLLTTLHQRYAPGWGLPTTCSTPPCGAWYNGEAGWFIRGSLRR